jgi:type I restriction enzyme S subunit
MGKSVITTRTSVTNQQINSVIVNEEHNYMYVYYLMRTLENTIKSLGKNGTAVPILSKSKFSDIDIQVHDLESQCRIAKILSAYDDLIENNQKQIKLLEEAAQRLYKEWFVDLRFPGYENTPITDGVPQGWKNGILDDIVFESGKNEKKENRENYSYYLPIDCLPKQSIGYTDTSDICLAESSLVAFSKNDIIFGAMRPYFHKVVVARDSGLTRSTCFVLNARESAFWAYVTMLMSSKDTVDYATQISVGTTMPYARWKDLKQMPIIIPTAKLAEEFQKNIKPIIDKIEVLSKAIMALRETRDCLLPKLMSGELEV